MAFFIHCLIFFAAAFVRATADTNLRGASLVSVAEQVDPALLHKLMDEVENALGRSLSNGTDARLAQIEDMLLPTFVALPKNSEGKLDHPAVRYALNRLFVQRHGWVIRGFQSDDDVYNASSAAQVLSGKVPELVQEIFERRIGEEGSSLHDIAVLAALFEHLIQEETTVRLRDIYQGYTDIVSFTPVQIKALTKHFSSIYPAWPETLKMLERVRELTVADLAQFEMHDISKLLNEAATAYYNDVHRSQCQNTKRMLLEMEDQKSGRVRLLDFYRSAIEEQRYQFTETITYLRHIGALDESDASIPKVIIPNYVSGQSNCVVRTKYYAVCCPDDCEAHFDQLEHALKKPEATPVEILAVMPDRQRISQLAIRRLDDIARQHGGSVPLHGRLFSQWLHFVYPQACVYPHEKGTVYTKTMEEWETETGQRSGSLVEEVVAWAKELSEQHNANGGRLDRRWDEGESGMWSMNEELVVQRAARTDEEGIDDSRNLDTSPRSFKRVFIIVAFSAGMAFLLFEGQWTKLLHNVYNEEHKYNV